MKERNQRPYGPHWACHYIGLPWQAGAQGPDAFELFGASLFGCKSSTSAETYRLFRLPRAI